MGAVESVKAASDIFAPVGGQIEEVNAALEDQPDLLNKSPEQDGPSPTTVSPPLPLADTRPRHRLARQDQAVEPGRV
jgi:hypothetical protein